MRSIFPDIQIAPGSSSNRSRNLVLFMLGLFMVSMAGGMFETTFNNYVNDTFSLSASARGRLEFPREMPGFLTAVMAGMLFFLPETRIAAAAAAAIGLGTLGLAAMGGEWGWMLVWVTLWSAGAHLIMPVRSSISMDLADPNRKGRRLGQIAGFMTVAGIAGCTFVWLGMKHWHAGYRLIFTVGGVCALSGAVFFWRMRMPGSHIQRPKFLWDNRYWLYYVLAFLFGARKQIFITFGPWLLVQVFHQPAFIFAQLWIAASVLGMLFQPALGRAIDRFGERAVLVADSILVFLVCAGYGLAHLVPDGRMALWILYACFVGDQLLFGVNMARDTYLARIAVKPEHIAPTLSLGITINHAVSMSIPALGGFAWMRYGHPSVFAGAACLALTMLAFSSLVRPRAR